MHATLLFFPSLIENPKKGLLGAFASIGAFLAGVFGFLSAI